MLYLIINFITDYLCYIIGGIIQLLFIILPVTLKNWEDDALNSLTYISFQLFVAGITFIISPWVFEVDLISPWMQIVLFGGIGLFSLFRVIKLIPFEFTFPVKLSVTVSKSIEFSGFNTIERHSLLSSLDFEDCDAQLRYSAFKEKLARLRLDKSNPDLED